MKFLNQLNNILKKPFPEQESRFGAPLTLTLISLFITFFLYIFEPFGIGDLEDNKFWVCLGFGSMTFLAAGIYEFIIGQLLKLKGEGQNWTFGKWILNNIAILFFVSLANFLFIRLAIFGYIKWEFFPHMVYGTLMVGLIPIIILGAFSLMSQERKYQHIATEINHQKPLKIINKPTNEQFIFDIPVNQIKYVEALQNYVQIAYLNSTGQLTKKTERATLKHISQKTVNSSVIQSHRSFLVNRDAIIAVAGNAQGLLLTLSDCDILVPVARSYVSVFKEN